jgi:di/tricarboxylate transporter
LLDKVLGVSTYVKYLLGDAQLLAIGYVNKSLDHDAVLFFYFVVPSFFVKIVDHLMIVPDEAHHLVLFVGFTPNFVHIRFLLLVYLLIMIFEAHLPIMLRIQVLNISQRVDQTLIKVNLFLVILHL